MPSPITISTDDLSRAAFILRREADYIKCTTFHLGSWINEDSKADHDEMISLAEKLEICADAGKPQT